MPSSPPPSCRVKSGRGGESKDESQRREADPAVLPVRKGLPLYAASVYSFAGLFAAAGSSFARHTLHARSLQEAQLPAQLPRGTWGPPRPGVQPRALQGRVDSQPPGHREVVCIHPGAPGLSGTTGLCHRRRRGKAAADASRDQMRQAPADTERGQGRLERAPPRRPGPGDLLQTQAGAGHQV